MRIVIAWGIISVLFLCLNPTIEAKDRPPSQINKPSFRDQRDTTTPDNREVCPFVLLNGRGRDLKLDFGGRRLDGIAFMLLRLGITVATTREDIHTADEEQESHPNERVWMLTESDSEDEQRAKDERLKVVDDELLQGRVHRSKPAKEIQQEKRDEQLQTPVARVVPSPQAREGRLVSLLVPFPRELSRPGGVVRADDDAR